MPPPWVGYVLLPALGAAVDIYLLTQLSSSALYLGFGWLALGIVYLAALTRGFRVHPPEFDPTEDPAIQEMSAVDTHPAS